MTRLVVVRVGNPTGTWATWFPRGKWSSPELENSQVIRNCYVEYEQIIVLFLTFGDIPHSMARVSYVRQRNPIFDVTFPLQNSVGPYRTFFNFTRESFVNISYLQDESITNVLDYVKYKRGHQILIPTGLASPALLFYCDTIERNVDDFQPLELNENLEEVRPEVFEPVMPAPVAIRSPITNVTTLNPEYFT
jgi:hypothetical protein